MSLLGHVPLSLSVGVGNEEYVVAAKLIWSAEGAGNNQSNPIWRYVSLIRVYRYSCCSHAHGVRLQVAFAVHLFTPSGKGEFQKQPHPILICLDFVNQFCEECKVERIGPRVSRAGSVKERKVERIGPRGFSPSKRGASPELSYAKNLKETEVGVLY